MLTDKPPYCNEVECCLYYAGVIDGIGIGTTMLALQKGAALRGAIQAAQEARREALAEMEKEHG